jgi:hypothetical protein
MLPESKIFEPAQFPDQDQHDSLDDLQDEKDDNNLSELDLQRTLSLVAHTPSKCIRQIPNGGLNAWLQVLGSFMLFFNTWYVCNQMNEYHANARSRGVTNAFGVFEAFYSTGYLRTDPSAISIVGAIQAFFLLGSGVIVGPLFDKGYFYQLLVVGSFLTVFGMMMTSLCTEYYQILLAQGLCVGFGSGCLFVPSVAIVCHANATVKDSSNGSADTNLLYEQKNRSRRYRLNWWISGRNSMAKQGSSSHKMC